MIVFELECRAEGHRFEGWFGSSAEFAEQQARGLVDCPQCGSADVAKAPMAPRLARKGNQRALIEPAPAEARSVSAPLPTAGAEVMPPPPIPPQVLAAMQAMAAMQAKALEQSRWVGERFADDVRAMHYGEREAETIHGRATADDAQELLEEGIAILPLPFPVAPPDELN